MKLDHDDLQVLFAVCARLRMTAVQEARQNLLHRPNGRMWMFAQETLCVALKNRGRVRSHGNHRRESAVTYFIRIDHRR